MSDEQQQDQQDQRDVDQQDQHQQESHETEDLGDKGRSAIQKEREARKAAEKERNELATRIADIEAKQREADEAKAKERGEWEKIAQQREAELAELKKSLTERDLNDKRTALARKHSLPDEIANRLVGETDDEIEEDAKRLAKLFARTDGLDTDSGKRSAQGNGKQKAESLLANYEFGKRR